MEQLVWIYLVVLIIRGIWFPLAPILFLCVYGLIKDRARKIMILIWILTGIWFMLPVIFSSS